MSIFAICVAKNEADIIGTCLEQACAWADKIFVMDNGSTDSTWEVVNSMKSDIIVPYRQSFEPFSNALRAEIFNTFKGLAKNGDWWCFRLDADEIYHESVKDFLGRVPGNYNWVLKKSIDFGIPMELIDTVETGSMALSDFRYFDKTAWIERRFFRFHVRDSWKQNEVLPSVTGIDSLYEKAILVFHYQNRSKAQVMQRYRDRLLAKESEPAEWSHIVNSDDWRLNLKSKNDLLYLNSMDDVQRAIPSTAISNRPARLLLSKIVNPVLWRI